MGSKVSTESVTDSITNFFTDFFTKNGINSPFLDKQTLKLIWSHYADHNVNAITQKSISLLITDMLSYSAVKNSQNNEFITFKKNTRNSIASISQRICNEMSGKENGSVSWKDFQKGYTRLALQFGCFSYVEDMQSIQVIFNKFIAHEQKVNCPALHGLSKLTSKAGYTCNLCKKLIPTDNSIYGCRICNWDSCVNCYTENYYKAIIRGKEKVDKALQEAWHAFLSKHTISQLKAKTASLDGPMVILEVDILSFVILLKDTGQRVPCQSLSLKFQKQQSEQKKIEDTRKINEEKNTIWVCEACTFENKGNKLTCTICGAERRTDTEGSVDKKESKHIEEELIYSAKEVHLLNRRIQDQERTITLLREQINRDTEEFEEVSYTYQSAINVLTSLLSSHNIQYDIKMPTKPPPLSPEEKEICRKVLLRWDMYIKEKRNRAISLIMRKQTVWIRKARQKIMKRNEFQTLKLFLEEEKNAGRGLTTEQSNFLLMGQQKEDAKYQCQVCLDDDFNLKDIFVLETCKHFLCQDCMTQHMVSLINNNKSSHMECPIFQCSSPITYVEVKRSVNPEEFQRYEQFTLGGVLGLDDNCRWCPRRGCQTPTIGNPDSPMIRCPKPNCHFTYCFNCKVEWHADITCEQYEQWKKDNGNGGDLFEKWRQKNTKPCPNCKTNIQKNGGCNHMTCTSCKYEFCWLCSEKYNSGHFSSKFNKCQQFT